MVNPRPAERADVLIAVVEDIAAPTTGVIVKIRVGYYDQVYCPHGRLLAVKCSHTQGTAKTSEDFALYANNLALNDSQEETGTALFMMTPLIKGRKYMIIVHEDRQL